MTHQQFRQQQVHWEARNGADHDLVVVNSAEYCHDDFLAVSCERKLVPTAVENVQNRAVQRDDICDFRIRMSCRLMLEQLQVECVESKTDDDQADELADHK